MYHKTDQTKGLAAHKAVDNKNVTTASNVLQSLEVYSHTYKLAGKIDTFDLKIGLLTERKKKIRVVYDGYIYQLYAQYHAMTDMGYQVNKIKLYSMDDNTSYAILLPHENPDKQAEFEQLIQAIRGFDLRSDFQANPSKCQRCIYNQLCDYAELETC